MQTIVAVLCFVIVDIYVLSLSLIAGLQSSFRTFGPMRVEWPGKDGKHPRYPSKGKELQVGYVYVHFECERSVKSLLQACTHDYSNGGEYYFKISSRRMRSPSRFLMLY